MLLTNGRKSDNFKMKAIDRWSIEEKSIGLAGSTAQTCFNGE